MAEPAAIAVDVTTVWTDPTRVRPVDAPIVATDPDPVAWARGLDVAARLDLTGRAVTQALRGEPVVVDEVRDGWARVVLPYQPSSLDERGYPGWLPAAHLAGGHPEPVRDGGRPLLDVARSFLGLDYLWAGLSSAGVDCSGLAAVCHRWCGVVIPRDAHDQARSGTVVPLSAVAGGDLVFFAYESGRGAIHHVGIAAGDGTMLHAPRTGRPVEHRALTDPAYAPELCAARRYLRSR